MTDSPRTNEWDAASYHRLSAPQFTWGRQVVERLRLQGGETVMDAGCGTGRLTSLLVERLPRGRVVAIDLSQNMLEEAGAYLSPRFGGRVEFVRADLASLPFDGAFDGVFSTAAFHWVPDHPRLFRSLYLSEFLLTVNMRSHVACLPEGRLRRRFVEELTEQAAADDPPYSLDYCRLNISARRPGAA